MDMGEMGSYLKFISLKHYPQVKSHQVGQKLAHVILCSEIHWVSQGIGWMMTCFGRWGITYSWNSSLKKISSLQLQDKDLCFLDGFLAQGCYGFQCCWSLVRWPPTSNREFFICSLTLHLNFLMPILLAQSLGFYTCLLLEGGWVLNPRPLMG